MTEAAPPAPDTAPARRAKGPLIGGALGLVLGGAAFGALYTGVVDPAALPGGRGESASAADQGGGGGEASAAGADIFLPLAPLVVSLAPGQGARHLRFGATIETAPGALPTVASVEPRVVDVLNGYLRAVAVAELEDPAAMPRLRAQMLRRVQLVVGGDAARDILITEFVLN